MPGIDEFHLYSALLILSALYFWLVTKRNDKNLPPSPPKLPIIGNLHQIGPLPHRSLMSLSKKHGPLIHINLGSKLALVVSSAEIAKEILKSHDISFSSKPDLSAINRAFYNGKDLLNLPYGDQWRKLRSIVVNQLLNSKRVKTFNSIRDQESASLAKKIGQFSSSSTPFNLTNMFASLTNDTICRAALGKKHSETKNGKLLLETMDEGVKLLLNFTIGEFVPWLSWINWLSGFDAKLDKCAEIVDMVMREIIQEHMDTGLKTTRGETFVDILLDVYKGNTSGVSIDMESIKAVIFDVFAAGTDTSSTSLSWAMTELIRNPLVMKKLQNEVRGIMKDKQDITDDDLHEMHYLRAVIKENLRLHPPLAIFTRSSREDVNLMGYDIPSGTMVIFNTWAIGRDAAYWDEPEKFMPERFLNCSMDYKGFDFEFLPFGSGRRICPGISFATASMEHVLANLMQKFDWELPGKAKGEELDVIEQPGFTIGRKNPLIVVATKPCF